MPARVEERSGYSNSETTRLLPNHERETQYKRTVKPASRTAKGFVLAACFILQMVSNGLGFGLGVMYVEVTQAFDAPRSVTALIQSLFMAITVSGGILWSPVIKRYGPGKCAFIGTLTSAVGLFASSYSTSVYMIIALTGILASFGMGICYLTPFIVANLTFKEGAGVALVFLTTGSSIGQFIFPYMYEILISEYGWSGAFILMSGLALQCAPPAVLIYGSRDLMTSYDDAKHKQSGCTMCDCDWKLFRQTVGLLLVFNCFLLTGTGNIEAWFLVDIMTSQGFERETGSLFVSLLGLFNFFGRFTGVVLRLKIKIPTLYHWLYVLPILGLSHGLVFLFSSYWPLLLSCLLYGYVFGVAVAQTPAIMLEIAGQERYADGMAFVNVFYGTGLFFGGTLGGITIESTGEYDAMFYLAISASLYMGVSSGLLVYILRRQKVKEVAQNIAEKSSISYKKLHNGDSFSFS